MGCYPPPGDLPNPGIEHTSPALAGGFFITESPEEPTWGLQACSSSHSHLNYDFSQNQHMILCFCVQGKIFLNNHHVQLAFFNHLIEIQFTCYTIHLSKVYNSRIPWLSSGYDLVLSLPRPVQHVNKIVYNLRAQCIHNYAFITAINYLEYFLTWNRRPPISCSCHSLISSFPALAIYFVSISLPILVIRINGIIQYVVLCDCFST